MKKNVLSPVRGDTIRNEKRKQQTKSISPSRAIYLPWPRIFLGVALIATIAGALFATKTLADIDRNITKTKEDARAANIKITKITTPNCIDCFNIESAMSQLKNQNVSVEEEKAVTSDSKEGQALIKQFAINRIPTYILSGEVKKKTIEGFVKSNGEVKENTFVFTNVTPVFIDSITKKEIGKVAATILTDPTCPQCVNPRLTIEAYKKAGVKIVDEKEVVWNSVEGQALMSQYAITKVPTFILSSDIDFYESVKTNWARIGTIESDKTYIARNLFPPYRDAEKGLTGFIDLIYLTDSTCTDCYIPEETQRNIITRGYGVGLASERTIDVNSSEGQSLISQYKITKVPTILLSPGVGEYAGVKNIWQNVGTVESDGWYVFREMQNLGGIIYKDLANNQVIRPAQVNGANNASQ